MPVAYANPRRRSLSVFAASVAILGVSACNVFDTLVFTPVGEASIELSLLPAAGESLNFRYSEYLQVAAEGSLQDTLVGEGTLRITHLGEDGPTGGRRYQRLILGDGTLGQRRDTVVLIQGDDGFSMVASAVSGGGFLPPGPIGDSASAAAAVSTFKLLPPSLESGNRWRLVQGESVNERILAGRDTLDSFGSLLEAWRVDEQFKWQNVSLGAAAYWFSGKGLLQAEWRWGDLALTSDRAEDMGQAGFKRVLRRVF